MATKTSDKIILPGNGTDQQQRTPDALNPDLLKLHNFSLADWMKFAWNFAEKVNYFDSSYQIDGNWQQFFIEEPQIKAFLESSEKDQTVTPHLTLFVCFLKLLDLSKDHFNQLTKRHLDFYYQEILKIEKLPLAPDQVHIIFELAKNILQEKIDVNTALDAGKDASGKKLIFTTQEEFVANKSTVSQLKNIYHHSETDLKGIKASTVANSLDGLGKALPADDMKWYPFGYVKKEYPETTPELPDAHLGFAVSSPVLRLNEGLRTVNLATEFQSILPEFSTSEIDACISVFLSGEKKWLGPFIPKSTFSDDTSGEKKILNFTIELDKKVKPVVGYNQTVLGERFQTTDPVMRFVVDTSVTGGYDFAATFSQLKLKSLELSVQVDDITSVEIENDLGILNAKKPFMPFGPIPVKGSRFILKNEEIFSKNWDGLSVNIVWMNTPKPIENSPNDPFKDQYFAYRKENFDDFTQRKAVVRKNAGKKNQDPDNLIVINDKYFEAEIKLFSNNDWLKIVGNKELFKQTKSVYGCGISILNNQFDTSENGRLQLCLNQSFLHEMFPRLYATAIMKPDSAPIPKEPYTPLIESIRLSYSSKAKATLNENTKENFGNNPVRLFHEHPFGQSEEHAYLKPKPAFNESVNIGLLPSFLPGGELYIGLKDAEPLQQISLLFQIFEGSENPEVDGFASGEKMEWSILGSNNWISLTSDYMISNQTDNFLKSGIVKFSIPPEATKDNTLLPSGLIWLRARMNKNFDIVCKIIDIRAQAVLAQFNDQGNELSHLKNGLPANTISKLIERIQSVKSVTQPFNSFGGLPAEADVAWYQRISERLRHKNRAITLWDYEHLVLQEFPEIHKVRCLNHTSKSSFLSPGDVTLVVIPDILNKNVFDLYQPRVSRATLNKIQSYINQLNTLHVNAEVINPEYEEVEISLKAKFHPGFDENYYLKVLQEDLTKLLSPWAFERTIDLQFGTMLHKSIIISYIEKLSYVDYITDLKVKHLGEYKPAVSPSNPKAILVSAKEHPVSIQPQLCAK
ncbi:MAG TPA: phage baseplate protein [Prolixibacteraceae bacterium]|nr:phage baseplate protein [Prolixibacteraceae bacterium]